MDQPHESRAKPFGSRRNSHTPYTFTTFIQRILVPLESIPPAHPVVLSPTRDSIRTQTCYTLCGSPFPSSRPIGGPFAETIIFQPPLSTAKVIPQPLIPCRFRCIHRHPTSSSLTQRCITRIAFCRRLQVRYRSVLDRSQFIANPFVEAFCFCFIPVLVAVSVSVYVVVLSMSWQSFDYPRFRNSSIASITILVLLSSAPPPFRPLAASR